MKDYLVYVMGAAYILAGLNHFRSPEFYEKMIRNFPAPHFLNIASGIAEIVLGIGLMFPQTRAIAAWGLIALLVAIFPANINMALHPEEWPQFSVWGLYLRLPIQLLLIYLAYLYTK